MAFILVTIFIDVLGIGIIIPILPELVKDFVGGSTASAGRWFGIIAATYAATQFFFAPVMKSALGSDQVNQLRIKGKACITPFLNELKPAFLDLKMSF